MYLMYLRKSRQDNQNETVEEVLARHEKQLQEYALKAFGSRISENNIYREIVSGETIEDRPQINKVIERIQGDTIKGVLVIEVQRLTRGDMLDCGTIVHAFRYTNTLIYTPLKTYDLTDKYDRKFFEMELSRGNDYLEYTKEILARGREASVREGNYIGSIAPFGYDRVKVGKGWTLVINETEAQYVRMAYQLYIEGLGATTIAHKLLELGAKPRNAKYINASTIRQMLTNEVYIGKIRWKHRAVERVYEDGKVIKKRPRNNDYELLDGKHEAIISVDTFNKAQEHKGLVSREKPDLSLKNIYAGLIKCSKCGKAIAYRHQSTRHDRYYCRSSVHCSTISANVSEVNNAILNALKDYLSDFEVTISNNNDDVITTHQRLINGLQSDLDKLEARQEELYDYLENKIYTLDVFTKRNAKLAEERDRLKSVLDNAKENTPTLNDYKEKCVSLHNVIDMLADDTIPAKIKNNFLKEVIKVVYYTKDSDGLRLEVILK